MPSQIYSLSLAINATLDMHNLNNEGSEGNQLQTRMVDIVGADGGLYSVNAISGDMLKHIQAEHFYNLAREQGLPLCAGCRMFNPNRINADQDFLSSSKERKLTDAQTLDELLQHCAMDDIAGILITEGGRSLPRKSIVEFGWAIGIPDATREGHNQSFFHVKYAPERGEKQRESDATKRVTPKGKTGDEERTGGANLQQAIFHRPANSGKYAIVCNLELARIGYNDITRRYAISTEERARRSAILIQSLLHTFVQLNGAMRSAQLPHLVALEGALAYSTKMLPAPLVSPINEDYATQMVSIAQHLGRGDGVVVNQFASLAGLAEQLSALVSTDEPYRMTDA